MFDQEGSAISVLTYGGTVDKSLTAFRKYEDDTVLQAACQTVSYNGPQGRKTGAALKAASQVFDAAAGGKKLLFLLVTGKSDDDVVGPAKEIVKKDISIFALGIGDSVDGNEIKLISRYYLVTKWRGLLESIVKVQNSIIKGELAFILPSATKRIPFEGALCTLKRTFVWRISLSFKGGGRGDTGDFEVSRHVSKQIAIAQKLYTRGGKSIYQFLKALCLLFPKSLKWDPEFCLWGLLWHRIITCGQSFDIMSTFKNTDS